MLEEFKLFSKQLRKEDKVIIMYDTDPDGISSAVLFNHFLSSHVSSILTYFNEKGEKHVKEEMLELIKKEEINKVVILDIAVDSDPESFKKLEQIVEGVVIVDHHPTLNDLSSHRTTFIKSDKLELAFPSHYYNTSKLVYDLINFITPIQEYAWKASIGIIGDMAYKKWEVFIKRSWKDIKELTRCVELIEMATSIGEKGIEDSYNALLLSPSPPILIEKLKRYTDIEEEVERVMKMFEREAEIDSNTSIIFFSFTSHYDIKSIISNKLSLLFPHYTVIINQIKEEEGEVAISLRNQLSNIHMGEVAQEVVKEIGKGGGGGHAPAAGITLPLEEYERFKEIIKRIINRKIKK